MSSDLFLLKESVVVFPGSELERKGIAFLSRLARFVLSEILLGMVGTLN